MGCEGGSATARKSSSVTRGSRSPSWGVTHEKFSKGIMSGGRIWIKVLKARLTEQAVFQIALGFCRSFHVANVSGLGGCSDKVTGSTHFEKHYSLCHI